MADVNADTTRLSLLLRLRQDPADQSAWRAFVERYGPRVYAWCRRWGLQEADAEDVTQNVLVILAERLHHFTYDPAGSFRAWLKTVAHHAWSKYVAGQQRAGQGSGDSAVGLQLREIAARDDLAARLEEEFDRELLEQAMLRVAQRVEGHTWQAFHLMALEGLPGAEVAARLDMPVAMVYVAKSRVQKQLQEEIRLLERGQ
jgi:RNA polymerase sigma-70 factor (ECF subfamily)